jgi:hypothetical protein
VLRPGRKNHTGAIAGGTVGGIAGVSLLALALWFWVIRPARKQQRPKDTYGDSSSEILSANKSAPGTFNLEHLDFRPESIEQLQRAREADLPSYNSSQEVRRGTSMRVTPSTG